MVRCRRECGLPGGLIIDGLVEGERVLLLQKRRLLVRLLRLCVLNAHLRLILLHRRLLMILGWADMLLIDIAADLLHTWR